MYQHGSSIFTYLLIFIKHFIGLRYCSQDIIRFHLILTTTLLSFPILQGKKLTGGGGGVTSYTQILTVSKWWESKFKPWQSDPRACALTNCATSHPGRLPEAYPDRRQNESWNVSIYRRALANMSNDNTHLSKIIIPSLRKGSPFPVFKRNT